MVSLLFLQASTVLVTISSGPVCIHRSPRSALASGSYVESDTPLGRGLWNDFAAQRSERKKRNPNDGRKRGWEGRPQLAMVASARRTENREPTRPIARPRPMSDCAC